MFCKSGAAIYDMGFPQDGGEILRCSSDCGHGKSLSVFISGIVEVIFALAKIDEFKLIFFRDKNICRLDISVTDSFTLQKRTCGNERGIKPYKLILCPEKILFLSLSVEILQIHISIHVFSDNAELVRVVLCFAKVVTVGADDVGMVLNFHKLYCLLLVLIKLIEVLGLHLLQSVD
jgi:hypothetical protein